MQLLFGQIFFDVVVLNGRNPVIDLLHLLRDDVHGFHLIVLGQQHSDGQANIACACDCNIHLVPPQLHLVIYQLLQNTLFELEESLLFIFNS